MILRFEPLEGRQLLTTGLRSRPDLVATAFDTPHNLDWGDSFHAAGAISNVGGGTTTAPFKVDVYASPGPAVGPTAVLLGQVTVPAGLTPSQSAHFDQVFTLPGIPLPASYTTQTVFIDLRVDPDQSVLESNRRNNERQGQGLDTSVVAITPHTPADLIGTAIGISPNSVSWGDSVTITAQVKNNAQGDAPPTRTRIVLTPAGLVPGGPADVTIGSFELPSVPAWQTVNVIHPVTLPAIPPSTLAGSTQFTLSLVHDANFQTNTAIAHQTAQGIGFDQAVLSVSPLPKDSSTKVPQAELAATGIQVPATPIAWGQSIQVSTTVQNLGPADAGPFRVRFLLAGPNGTVADSLFLADATVDGLKASFSQDIQQTVRIPSRLPFGLELNGAAVARILVMVDPENMVDEPLRSNNVTGSAPIRLRLIGTDGTTQVPTSPSGNPVTTGTNGYSPNQAHPLGNATRGVPTTQSQHPFSLRLKPPKHGLHIFPKSVEKFFQDIGRHLSITGHSRR